MGRVPYGQNIYMIQSDMQFVCEICTFCVSCKKQYCTLEHRPGCRLHCPMHKRCIAVISYQNFFNECKLYP